MPEANGASRLFAEEFRIEYDEGVQGVDNDLGIEMELKTSTCSTPKTMVSMVARAWQTNLVESLVKASMPRKWATHR